MGDFYKMRLYNTYYLCKQCETVISKLNILTISANTVSAANQIFIIENYTDYKDALFILRQISAFTKYVDDFYDTIPVFVREKPRPEFDLSIKQRLEAKGKVISCMVQTIIELYESLNLGEDNNGIDVKIPSCESLDQYISLLKEIDFIFTQCPFLQHSDGQIKFNTVDVGSQWINFTIYATTGVAAATFILKNLAMLVDMAVQTKSHILNLKEQEEIIKSQSIQNNILESNHEIFDELKKHYLSKAVEDLELKNEEGFLKDGEERGKAEKSLEKLCGLLDKGVEIYASIDTQKDIQVLFPALKDKVELPYDIIKLIENNKE